MNYFQKRPVLVVIVFSLIITGIVGAQMLPPAQPPVPTLDPFLQQATDIMQTATAVAQTIQPQTELSPQANIATLINQGTQLAATPGFIPPQPLELTISAVAATATAFVQQVTAEAASGTNRLSTPIPPATIYALATDRRATFDTLQLSATLDPILAYATQIIAEVTQAELNNRATLTATAMPPRGVPGGIPAPAVTEETAPMPTAAMPPFPFFQSEQYMQATVFAEAVAADPALLLTATIPGCYLISPPLFEQDLELGDAITANLAEISPNTHAGVIRTLETRDCVTYQRTSTMLDVSVSLQNLEGTDLDTLITEIVQRLSSYPAAETGIQEVWLNINISEPFTEHLSRHRGIQVNYGGDYSLLLDAYARGLRGFDLLEAAFAN